MGVIVEWGRTPDFPLPYNASVMSEFDKHLKFGMFHFTEARNMLSLVKNRHLELRDICVLFAVMSLCDSRTAKSRFMVKSLAEMINSNPTAVSASLSRLKKNFLVASFFDSATGEKYYMVNPYLLSVGRKSNWGKLRVKFLSVFNEEEISHITDIDPWGSSDLEFNSGNED